MTELLKLIKITEVCKRTAQPKPTIYWRVARGEFPKPIKQGVRAAAWIESEVDTWIAERIKSARPAQ